MKVTVLPRLQSENFSLYWKESMETKTACLEPLELECSADETVLRQWTVTLRSVKSSLNYFL